MSSETDPVRQNQNLVEIIGRVRRFQNPTFTRRFSSRLQAALSPSELTLCGQFFGRMGLVAACIEWIPRSPQSPPRYFKDHLLSKRLTKPNVYTQEGAAIAEREIYPLIQLTRVEIAQLRPYYKGDILEDWQQNMQNWPSQHREKFNQELSLFLL